MTELTSLIGKTIAAIEPYSGGKTVDKDDPPPGWLITFTDGTVVELGAHYDVKSQASTPGVYATPLTAEEMNAERIIVDLPKTELDKDEG
jgi:hypothetical protein